MTLTFTETSDGKVSLMKEMRNETVYLIKKAKATGGRRLGRTGLPQRVAPELGRPLDGMHPEYPYENIVFQGGGAKGVIYAGCLMALDDLGILPYVKRLAGASAGCGPALFAALGLSGAQVEAEVNRINMVEFFDGGKHIPCGLGTVKKVYLGWSMWKKLGMHPADKVLDHFGEVLEKYTGNADLTFLELYHQCGRELCIAVSNVSRAQSEFCHVNTTPDMPIRRAIRASMSLPVLWEPVELFKGEKYVDGGLFTNFPLKAFDGWFLSTNREDNIRTQVLKQDPEIIQNAAPHEIMKAYKEAMATSFAKPNMATIGFRVSNDDAPDEAAYATYLNDLETRLKQSHRMRVSMNITKKLKAHIPDIEYPDTVLANAYLEKKSKEKHLIECSAKYELAYVELNRWIMLHGSGINSDKHPHGIDSAKFAQLLMLKKPGFSLSIFGFKSWGQFVKAMDYGNKGYVTRTDASRFWDTFHVRHPFMKNRKAKSLETLGALSGELLNSMYNVAEESLLRDPNNAKRICMLSTKYVGLLDLALEQEDKDFLYKLGKRGTIAWINRQ